MALIERIKSQVFAVIVLGSGVAGLGYQMVWTRLLAVSLGHEIAAVLAVIAAFFIGLALGGLLINRTIQNSHRPAVWYCALELIIALWAAVLTVLVPIFNQHFPVWLGPQPQPWLHWLASFIAAFLLLAPATIAMGATLPALERIIALYRNRGDQVSRVYAFNTLGAVIGCLITAFYWVPTLGLKHTLLILACINALCAVAVYFLFGGHKIQAAGLQASGINAFGEQQSAANIVNKINTKNNNQEVNKTNTVKLLTTFFLVGWLGIGYEVIGIRVLSQVLENTVYSFAVALASFLLFNALGAFVYQRFFAGRSLTYVAWQQRLKTLLMATAAACLVGMLLLSLAPKLYFIGLAFFAGNIFGAVFIELGVAAMLFALPTFCMGLLFCHLAERAVATAGLGKALACNTLGAAFAPACFGIVALPVLGAKWSFVCIALGYIALQIMYLGVKKYLINSTLINKPFWKKMGGIKAGYQIGYGGLSTKFGIVALGLFTGIYFSPLQNSLSESEGTNGNATVRSYYEGVLASVAVIEDAARQRYLKVNNHFTMGGTATRFSDHRQSHLPLLLHGNPHSALYLGLGTGITMEAAGFYPNLDITGVELIPEVLPLLQEFGVSQQTLGAKLLTADARRFVLADQHQYDVIIGEIFHPSRDGAGALYTLEHFKAVQQRLAPDGVFAQWLPLFQLDVATLKTIAATFLTVFPNSQLYLGHLSLDQPILCLVGSKQPKQFSADWLMQRVTYRPLQRALVDTRLNSDYALFGGFLAGPKALQQFTQGAPLNTDDLPIVTYKAPGFVYRGYQAPAERLRDVLNFFGQNRNALPLTKAASNTDFGERLALYLDARDQFLLTGIDALNSNSPQQLLATTRAPLLQIVRNSADFEPAYRTLLASAQSLYQTEPNDAFDLLTAMEVARPEYNEARQLKLQLFSR